MCTNCFGRMTYHGHLARKEECGQEMTEHEKRDLRLLDLAVHYSNVLRRKIEAQDSGV